MLEDLDFPSQNYLLPQVIAWNYMVFLFLFSCNLETRVLHYISVGIPIHKNSAHVTCIIDWKSNFKYFGLCDSTIMALKPFDFWVSSLTFYQHDWRRWLGWLLTLLLPSSYCTFWRFFCCLPSKVCYFYELYLFDNL